MKFRLPTLRFFIRNFLQQNSPNGLGKIYPLLTKELSLPKNESYFFFVLVHKACNWIADQLSMIRPSR